MGLLREGVQVADLMSLEIKALTTKKLGSLDAVYVISTGDGIPCKIGHAGVPAKRLSTLQTSYWEDFYLAHVSYFSSPYMGELIEAICHKSLQSSGLHIRGEWFNVTVEQAERQIERAAYEYGVPRFSDAAKIKEKWKESLQKPGLVPVRPLTEEEKAYRNRHNIRHMDAVERFKFKRRQILSQL